MRPTAEPRQRTSRPAGSTREPRPYDRPPSPYWWLERRSYFLFLVRELTSVFVAAYSLFLIVVLFRLGDGPGAHARTVDFLVSPLSLALHLVVLAFVLFHAITWFNLTPKIMVLHRGEEQVPPLLVAGLVYAGWIGLSALLFFLFLRG